MPLYPAHRDYEGAGSQRGREHWLPVFDEFGLTVGLEHHDQCVHADQAPQGQSGGDAGHQGHRVHRRRRVRAAARTIAPQPRWYSEKEGSATHFWVIDVARDRLLFTAIDETGATRDAFGLP